MNAGCVTQTGIVSGGQITTLVQGTKYYVNVVASASPGYLVSAKSTTTVTSVMATVQLNAAVITNVSAGQTPTVTFTIPSNAPVGQTYTVLACTSSTMSSGCTGPQSIASGGGQITTSLSKSFYFYTITAGPSTGYFASTSNIFTGPKA